MTTNQTIDGVPRELLERIAESGGYVPRRAELRALLDSPVDTRTETVPKHKFDTLVQHCKRLEGDIAQARAHVNEITLYQQNAVWFWQHDGEDFPQSLSCPIIIQPHHLRELLKGVAPAAQPQGEPVAWMTRCIKGTGLGVVEQADGPGSVHNNEYWTPAFSVYAEQPAPVAVVMPGRRPIPAGIESLAQQVYQSWESQPGFVPWVDGGNSTKQDEARQIASRTFELALANQMGD